MTTLYVPLDYATVDSAIGAAVAGDTIDVRPGAMFDQPIKVTKSDLTFKMFFSFPTYFDIHDSVTAMTMDVGGFSINDGVGDTVYTIGDATNVAFKILGGRDRIVLSGLDNPLTNLTIDWSKDTSDQVFSVSDGVFTSAVNSLEGAAGSQYYTINCGSGNDAIDIRGVGVGTFTGGSGNDVYSVDGHFGRFSRPYFSLVETIGIATGGDDEVVFSGTTQIAYELPDNIERLTLAGNHDASVTGNKLDNIITGDASNNTLKGMGGVDQLVGGAGNDTYYTTYLEDTIVELADGGIDTLWIKLPTRLEVYTLPENIEKIFTGTRARLNGNDADNYISNSSKSVIDGKGGADVMKGGYADNVYMVDNAGDKVIDPYHGEDLVHVNLASGSLAFNDFNGTVKFHGSGDIGIAINENASRSYSLNKVIGNAGDNKIHVFSGPADLFGNAGDDVLWCGRDDDTLTGGAGADRMIGGIGKDTYVDIDADDVIIEAALEGGANTADAATFGGRGGRTLHLADNVERLDLTGTQSLVVFGNDSDNIIWGTRGDSVVTGGRGADWMFGGLGRDVFRYVDKDDSFGEFNEIDRISAFQKGQDKIDLSSVHGEIGDPHSFSLNEGQGGQFSGAAMELRYRFVGGKTILEGDIDGNKIADLKILLTGYIDFENSDFIF